MMQDNSQAPVDLAGELVRAWAAEAMASAEPALPERFGDIYFAPLGIFAKGAPHFGMVRGKKKGPVGRGVLRLSPITSCRQSGESDRKALFMPAATRLCRVDRRQRLSKDSWMLLHFGPIPLRRELLQEMVATYQAHHVGWLPEEWIDKVRAKLKGGPEHE